MATQYFVDINAGDSGALPTHPNIEWMIPPGSDSPYRKNPVSI